MEGALWGEGRGPGGDSSEGGGLCAKGARAKETLEDNSKN